jgi:excisionase family DNA binding protein
METILIHLFPSLRLVPPSIGSQLEARKVEKQKLFFSVEQIADEFGVTQACIRRWILLRKLTVVKLGRLVRIPVAEADRLVREGTIPARERSYER